MYTVRDTSNASKGVRLSQNADFTECLMAETRFLVHAELFQGVKVQVNMRFKSDWNVYYTHDACIVRRPSKT